MRIIRETPKYPISENYLYKYGKNKLRIDVGSKGVTIWLNDRWILDGSCISEEGSISIDIGRMKKIKAKYPKTHADYQIKSKEKLE